MNSEDLYRLIDEPSLLDKETLPELRQIVEAFPYFQTARMLYLKNLAILGDIRFSSELKRMSVFLPDRKKLFQWIEGEHYGLRSESLRADEVDIQDSFSLIDAFLSDREDDPLRSQEAEFSFQHSISSDYMYWSLSKEEKEGVWDEKENKLRYHDLIDSFIESEQKRMPGDGVFIPENAPMAESPASVKALDDEQSFSLEDSCLTETLARIYVKQKRYEKAVQIIKNLSLKYPEKNIYFADQIRFLEKLIINTKK